MAGILCRQNPLFLSFFTLTLLSSSLHVAFSDLSASRSALLSLRDAVGGRTLFWDTSAYPCRWSGVFCDAVNATVTGLHLPGFSLAGDIPLGIFPNLSSLRTLSLRSNLLSGKIPSDLASCTELRNLYLQDNQFSGEIPDSISSLQNLVRVSLASNNLTGRVKSSLSNLTRVKTLYLQDNQLSGPLPELNLNLDLFNISNNRVNGTIPVSLSSLPEDAFSGTKLCGKPLAICPGLAAGTGDLPGAGGSGGGTEAEGKGKKKGLSGGVIAGIVMGAVLALVLIVMIIVCVRGKRKQRERTRAVDISSYKRPEVHISSDKPSGDPEAAAASGNSYSVAAAAAAAMAGNGNSKSEVNVVGGGANKKLVFFGNPPKVFDLEDLLRASAEVLGKGTFGTAYKAVLEIGAVVAVKRLKDVAVSETEFRDKIDVVGSMNHENLVPLRAYYFSREEKLLVYDYMPMGSLSALLHGNKGAGRTPLSWEIRAGIALGTARGISYLHSSNMSHGNIKSSNILLTKSHQPKVSDFGLACLVGPSSTPNRVTSYRAPEVTDPRRVSQKADVYSYGVLLLELLTGKAPTHALLNEEGVDLPRWVQSIVKEEWSSEVFDLELLRYENVEEEMVQLLQLAIDCAGQHPDNRPSMFQVTQRIEDLCGSSIREVRDDPPSVHDIDDVSSH